MAAAARHRRPDFSRAELFYIFFLYIFFLTAVQGRIRILPKNVYLSS